MSHTEERAEERRRGCHEEGLADATTCPHLPGNELVKRDGGVGPHVGQASSGCVAQQESLFEGRHARVQLPGVAAQRRQERGKEVIADEAPDSEGSVLDALRTEAEPAGLQGGTGGVLLTAHAAVIKPAETPKT